jgi:SAM-dependent methyltransferase
MMKPLVEGMKNQFMHQVPRGVKVLDVGCSTGFFMDAIAKEGYQVYGCDLNPQDVPFVRDVLGYPCEEGGVETAFPGQPFDVICSFNVIEHVADPVEWVVKAKERLVPSGILYTQTPNINDALVSVYDVPEFRDRWYREPHITYFSRITLLKLMEMGGFTRPNIHIDFNQFYTLANHLHWLQWGTPMPTATAAQTPPSPRATKHPYSLALRSFLQDVETDYKKLLTRLGLCDQLVAIARKDV